MDRRLIAALTGEALGTFLFVFVGVGCIVVGGLTGTPSETLSVALAHGITLAVVVTAFAAISGGHINPAVTIALLISGSIDAVRGALYIGAQLIGAVLGALVVRATFGDAAWQTAGFGKPSLAANVDPATGLVLEVVMTSLLVTAVFFTAVDPRAAKLGGLLIGLSIVGDILVGGPVTGAAMNPARWFGPAVASADFSNAAVWTVGPILGGIAVALVYRFLFVPAREELEAIVPPVAATYVHEAGQPGTAPAIEPSSEAHE
jgi:MIP family channel proteins